MVQSSEYNKRFIIGLIYRPPNARVFDNLKLFSLLKLVEDYTKKDELILIGDFNYPNIDWKHMTASRVDNIKFFKVIQDSFWFQNISEFTRFRTGNNPSLLDLLFTRRKDAVRDVQYKFGLGKSDHVMIQFTVDGAKEENVKKFTPSRNYRKGNYEAMNNIFHNIEWEKEFDKRDTNECYSFLIETIYNTTVLFVPMNTNPCIIKTNPSWLNAVAKAVLRQKEKCWNQYKNKRVEKNLQLYIKARNKATAVKRKVKGDFESRLITNIGKDKSVFNKYVRSRVKTRSGIGFVMR